MRTIYDADAHKRQYSRVRQPICRICLTPIWPQKTPKGWVVLDEHGRRHICRLHKQGKVDHG